MSKTFILCEKPSQAMDFVKGLSQKEQEKFDNNDGYFESANYIICFARGHLVEPYMPEEYDERYKTWKLEDLPIIPNPVKYRVNRKDKSAQKLYRVIAGQINRKEVNRIVVATDAEREGELIARLIINHTGVDTSNKDMRRFWTSSALTPDEIIKGMQNMKPLKDYDRYYRAASARQKADYIVGLNGTRAATLSGKAGVISLGRVQTPVLNIIYMRDTEIEDFKPEKYYEISAKFKKDDITYKAKYVDDSNKTISFKDKNEAQALVDGLSNIASGKILSVTKTKEKQSPPKIYSLSSLQKEASSKAGISASNVLNILQRLYDMKVTTYPRTDSEVLSSDMVGLAQSTIKKLEGEYSSFIKDCVIEGSNKNVFNDEKLTDHHGLIPTGEKPEHLSEQEKLIYDMVVKRFIAVFMPNYEYEQTKVVTALNNHKFYSTGKRVLNQGWKAIYNESEKEDLLPALVENADVEKVELKSDEKETTPPSHFNDGSLIEAMSNAGKFVEDEQLKKVLKDSKGIGTPATKAAIIETLIDRGFINRKGKQLLINPSGKKLIETLQGEQILDPVFTAMWEQELEKIASGEVANTSAFLKNIEDYTKYLVESLAGKDLAGIGKGVDSKLSKEKEVGVCPECNSPVITYKNAKGYFCSNQQCQFVLWKNKLAYLGRQEILDKEAKDILKAYQEGTTADIDGLISKKTGKAYIGKVKLVKDDKYGWGLTLQFENATTT